MNTKNIAKYVLLFLGVLDLVRGFMHTFNVNYASEHIAGAVPACSTEDPGADQNYKLLMNGFGGANFQTGFINILIAVYKPVLAPYILALIAISYLLTKASGNFNKIEPTAKYPGRYMMLGYNILAGLTAIFYFYKYGNKLKK